MFVVTCRSNGLTELYSLRKATTQEVLEKLSEVYCRCGFPERLNTDNNTYFTAKSVPWYVCNDGCLVAENHLLPYPVQCQRAQHQDMQVPLCVYTKSHNDFDAHLDAISFALCASVNHSTDFRPAFLMFAVS